MTYPAQKQKLRLSWEMRRSGKSVTIIHGFTVSLATMEQIARDIKQALGTGGHVLQEGKIEIQGDQRERLRIWLIKNALPVK